jgi:uncharacterized protein (DUF1778 family)
MRVADDVDAIAPLAAEHTDQRLTGFVVQAARVVAEDTLADRRVSDLDETAWDEFVEISDGPPGPSQTSSVCCRLQCVRPANPWATRA